MSDEQDKLKLSLEPPKLFGRKKKSDAMGTTKRTSPAPADSEPETASAAEPTPEPVTEPDAEPDAEPTLVDVPVVEEEPVVEKPVVEKPVVEKPVVDEPVVEAPPPPVTTAKKSAPAKKPAPAKEPVPARKPARPRAKLAPDIEPEPIAPVLDTDDDISPADADEPPLLPLYPAAAVTGVLVGATMVILTWLSLRGCEAIRGTSSCGGGPGFLLLIATFVVCILLGSALLKVFQIPDPGSSSFLGVGLVAVVSLLFLIDVLDHWASLIVVPVISVGAFLASVWVTKTFVEPGET